MAQLKHIFVLLFLCALSFQLLAQEAEEKWANLEMDAGILGFSSFLMTSSSSLTIYDPQDFESLMSFQISRVKEDRWGLWLGFSRSSSSANLSEEAEDFSQRLFAQHPNDFIFDVNDSTYTIKYVRKHIHFGVMKREKLGKVHLNFGGGVGAYYQTASPGLRFIVKEQGSNVRSEYTYSYGEGNAWNWSATVYADADMNLYRSRKFEWNVFGRVSGLGFGKIGEIEERKAPLHVPATYTSIEDEGMALRMDVVIGLRMRMINIQGWKMFNR